jgi:hypothetical protein
MFHSYAPILGVYVIALAITCVLVLLLGPYPYPQDRRAMKPTEQQAVA